MRDWLTPDEAGRLLGVTRQRILQLRQSGAIASVLDVSQRVKVSRESVERLLAERTTLGAQTAAQAAERASLQHAESDRMRRNAKRFAEEKAERDAAKIAREERLITAVERLADLAEKAVKRC